VIQVYKKLIVLLIYSGGVYAHVEFLHKFGEIESINIGIIIN